jgi:hypothetical protein
MRNPIAKNIVPIMSVGALKSLLPPPYGGKETYGLLSSVTGKLTVHTQIIWKTQNPKNLKKSSLLSSNRSSFPVLRIRKRRNPESRTPQSITKRETTILRVWTLSEIPIDRVIIARMTKLVPPAKSVLENQQLLKRISYNLSNRNVQAIEKKRS